MFFFFFRSVSVQRSQLFFPEMLFRRAADVSHAVLYKMIRYGVMKNKITAVDEERSSWSFNNFSLTSFLDVFFHQFYNTQEKGFLK